MITKNENEGRKRLKEWVYEQAMARERTPHTINRWLKAGRFPGVRLERLNQRVIFVVEE